MDDLHQAPKCIQITDDTVSFFSPLLTPYSHFPFSSLTQQFAIPSPPPNPHLQTHLFFFSNSEPLSSPPTLLLQPISSFPVYSLHPSPYCCKLIPCTLSNQVCPGFACARSSQPPTTTPLLEASISSPGSLCF